MIRWCSTRRLPARAVLVLTLLCLWPSHPAAQGTADAWYARSAKPKDFETPKKPLGAFTIELPKGWQLVRGYGFIQFTVAEKGRADAPAAAISLERLELQSAATVSAAYARIELTSAQERESTGSQFVQSIKEADGRRVIFIQYTRRGAAGDEAVTQYSVPVGAAMYRLICVAPAAQQAKYQPLFAHVAVSFRANPAAGG